jgi:hypothetical protein
MPQLVPSGLLQPLAVGAGWHEVIGGVAPAAAADFTLPMDSRYITRVLAVTCRLVSDANAANRSVRVLYEDSAGNVLALAGTSLQQAASKTVDYSFLVGVGAALTVTDLQSTAPLPAMFLRGTDVLRIDNVNAQAGDQLSRVFVTVERFFSDGPE